MTNPPAAGADPEELGAALVGNPRRGASGGELLTLARKFRDETAMEIFEMAQRFGIPRKVGVVDDVKVGVKGASRKRVRPAHKREDIS